MSALLNDIVLFACPVVMTCCFITPDLITEHIFDLTLQVGRKKWWLVPMSETAYVYPSLNPNGFSAHALTFIGKGEEEQSSWLTKLNRWEVTLNPGDVLLNPPWTWHGVMNVEGKRLI